MKKPNPFAAKKGEKKAKPNPFGGKRALPFGGGAKAKGNPFAKPKK